MRGAVLCPYLSVASSVQSRLLYRLRQRRANIPPPTSPLRNTSTMKYPLLAALPFLFTNPFVLAQVDTPVGAFHLTTLGPTLLNRFVPELWTDMGVFRRTV